MSNEHLHPLFKQILDSFQQIGVTSGNPTIKSSTTVSCYVCGGIGYNDQGACMNCRGTGLLWTNGGGR